MEEDDDRQRARVDLAANLHPEDFQPRNIHRPGGRSLQEALTALVPVGIRGMVSSHLARLDAGLEPSDADTRMRGWLWNVLHGRLRNGELTAQARELGETRVGLLATDMFDDAAPDFQHNRLICNGVTFGSVRVFERSAVPSLPDQPPEPLQSDALERAVAWMTAHVSQRSKRDDAVLDCRKEAKVTNAIARVAWSGLPVALKGTRGRHKA